MAPWKDIAEQKRNSILHKIPEEWRIRDPPSRQEQRDVTGKYIQQFLSEDEVEITETDVVGIAAKTTTGRWTAESVTSAFCHRAALAHQLTNCLLEIFFEDALEHARKLDAHLASAGKAVGPLHGVPVSLKDQFHVRGVETTMGYVGWLDTFEGVKGTGKEKMFESELVRELRSLGAVLYCKTSVPHTLMSGETVNNIVGYCWNPRNRNLSAGGSSGGEGALIALKGSPVGFGSDIGGSIRIPAAFNGLFGLRPSSGRAPYEGVANSMDGQNTVLSVLGPIASTIESLQLVFKAILSQEPWLHDPLCHEIPWRSTEEQAMLDLLASGQKLCFGIATHNNVVRPHPPIERAMGMVCEALQSLGHHLLEWRPRPSHDELASLTGSAWTYDGGKDVHNAMSLCGEPLVPQVSRLYGSEPTEQKTASHIHAVNVAKRNAQKSYMEYWNSTAGLTSTGRPVDCLICPVAPSASVRPETYTHYSYSSFVNTLDYTSVVIPVTFADENIDIVDEDPLTPLGSEDVEVNSLYVPEIFHGAPVGLQLVGRRLQEERMLALAAYVSKALAEHK